MSSDPNEVVGHVSEEILDMIREHQDDTSRLVNLDVAIGNLLPGYCVLQTDESGSMARLVQEGRVLHISRDLLERWLEEQDGVIKRVC